MKLHPATRSVAARQCGHRVQCSDLRSSARAGSRAASASLQVCPSCAGSPHSVQTSGILDGIHTIVFYSDFSAKNLKLCRARSRLYESRCLQVNTSSCLQLNTGSTHFSDLFSIYVFEVYQIVTPFETSKLNSSAKCRQTCFSTSRFSTKCSG